MDSPLSMVPGRHVVPLTHGGLERAYLLQIPRRPATGPAGPALPLVIELHGRGIDADRFDQMTGFGALADEAGFVLAMPNAVGEMWNDGRIAAAWAVPPDDVAYIAAIIDDASARCRIDPGRVFVAGMSNGAAMAGRVACELADRVAAVAQIAGTAGAEIVAGCHPVRPVAILDIHGTADQMAPYEGGSRRGLMGHLMLRRGFASSVSVDAWAEFWVAANGAAAEPATAELPPDTTIRTWRGATPASDVTFYRVEGAGHTWPSSRITLPSFVFGRTSRTFDATRVSWEFFQSHGRQAVARGRQAVAHGRQAVAPRQSPGS
jgi:polyhydroxybutyrate depolymerase